MSNQRLAYLCNRIQKITDAIYRVTDLLSDKEPMKWEVRNRAVLVFTNVISLRGKSFAEKNNAIHETKELINQLSALLSLFAESGTISSVNFEILKDEYGAVKKFISQEKQEQDFIKFNLDEPKKSLPQPIGQTNGHSIGHIGSSSGKTRKDKILEIIKAKGEVSIGELSSVFAECSEKTVQRDLLEMVAKGVLKKEGDKRWRRYSLII